MNSNDLFLSDIFIQLRTDASKHLVKLLRCILEVSFGSIALRKLIILYTVFLQYDSAVMYGGFQGGP